MTDQIEMIDGLYLRPNGLCPAQGLLVSPADAVGAGLSDQRITQRHIRPASALLQRVLELDGAAPLH